MNTKARSTITKEANGLTFVASAYVDDEGATSGLCVKLLDDSGEPVNIDCEAVITAKTTNNRTIKEFLEEYIYLKHERDFGI